MEAAGWFHQVHSAVLLQQFASVRIAAAYDFNEVDVAQAAADDDDDELLLCS